MDEARTIRELLQENRRLRQENDFLWWQIDGYFRMEKELRKQIGIAAKAMAVIRHGNAFTKEE